MGTRASDLLPALVLLLSGAATPSQAEERTYSAIGESVMKPKAILNAMRLARRMAPPDAENVSVSPKGCSKEQGGGYRCEAEVTFEVPEASGARDVSGYGVSYGYVDGERPTRPSPREIVPSPAPRPAPRAVDEDAFGNYLNADNGRGQRYDGTLVTPSRDDEGGSFLAGLGDVVGDAIGTAAALAPAAAGVAGALRGGSSAAGVAPVAPAGRTSPSPVRTNPPQRAGGSDISGTEKLRDRK